MNLWPSLQRTFAACSRSTIVTPASPTKHLLVTLLWWRAGHAAQCSLPTAPPPPLARAQVKWSRASAQRIAGSAVEGSARNHSSRKHKYKEWLGLPNTVGNVERVYQLPEALASKDHGPPTCVSVEDAADYDVEEGKSASEGVGWEGRVMRWAVLMPCTKQTYGAVDVTQTLPKYNGSNGTPIVKLGQLPRDGRLLLLQYTRPRNIDPYAQLKGFKRFTSQAGEEPSARAARAGAAVKFIVFSRARSASTTFITALNAHPNVSCGYEIFSPHNFAADGLREALGFDTHAEVMARMPEFMKAFWSLCPSLACGFKVFPGQVCAFSAQHKLPGVAYVYLLLSHASPCTHSSAFTTSLIYTLLASAGAHTVTVYPTFIQPLLSRSFPSPCSGPPPLVDAANLPRCPRGAARLVACHRAGAAQCHRRVALGAQGGGHRQLGNLAAAAKDNRVKHTAE